MQNRAAVSSRFFSLIIAAVLSAGSLLDAHDFWIESSTFRPVPGSTIGIRLRVGEHFVGDAVPRNPKQIQRFVIAGRTGEKPIGGRTGADPAGLVTIEEPGLLVIGYRSHRSSVELAAKEFEQYLSEEGLERIVALRAERGERDKPGREVFSRCAKSLISSGPQAGEGHDRLLGLTLELVPEKNPYALRRDEEIPIRLLYEGKPLDGALIIAMNRQEPDKMLKARSDQKGRVVFRLPQTGVWLVKAVHMIPAPPATGADWESLWGSLTFEVPPRAN